MRKLVAVIFVGFLAAAAVGGCRTPKVIKTTTDTNKATIVEALLDTTESNETTKVVINKIDSNQTEMTIIKHKKKTRNKKKKNETNTITSTADSEINTLEPTLKKIDRGRLNDSLKNTAKIEKQKAKSNKFEFYINLAKAVIIAIFFVIFLKCISKTDGI